MGRQSALHKENSGFATPTLGRHISTFRGYRILFSIRNPYINRFTNHFSIHSWPSYPQKVVLHSSTARFSHTPYHFCHVSYFSAIKRDLAILTEWWQQRIGMSTDSVSLIESYLSNRKQQIKINGIPSSWSDIQKGVPQGSILGTLLFNVFINEIFYFVKKGTLYNYADDNTLSYESCIKHHNPNPSLGE